jgi:two-component system response regulator NreC
MRPIRLVLIDDHQLVRDGLRGLLQAEGDIRIVGEAGSVAGIASIDADPDVVVCDLVLGDGRGAEVVRAARERFADAHVLILTMVDNPSDVQLTFAAGARGYLLKEAAASDLVDAVRRVAAGEVYLQPALGAALAGLRRATGGAHASAELPISERETGVLRLLALGHTNAEIASILGVSLRTVESHRSSLLHKLNVRTRAELVGYATAHGLLDAGRATDRPG